MMRKQKLSTKAPSWWCKQGLHWWVNPGFGPCWENRTTVQQPRFSSKLLAIRWNHGWERPAANRPAAADPVCRSQIPRLAGDHVSGRLATQAAAPSASRLRLALPDRQPTQTSLLRVRSVRIFPLDAQGHSPSAWLALLKQVEFKVKQTTTYKTACTSN